MTFEEAYEAYRQGDYATALNSFLALAEQGDPQAQYQLSAMYFAGHGVAQDVEQAEMWCRKAASQGDPSAQIHLGWMCLKGTGVTQDEAEGVSWIAAAAKQGLASAQFSLGFLHHQGWGVSRDPLKAYQYAKLAAESGDHNGAQLLLQLKTSLTATQLEKAEQGLGDLRSAPSG